MTKHWLLGGCLLAAPVVFVAGIVTGRLFEERFTPVVAPAVSAIPAEVQPAARSVKQSDSAPTPTEPHASRSTLQRLRGIVELNEVLPRKLNVSILSGEELNPDFVRLFDLSPRQVANLKQAFADARESLAELEAQHAKIEKPSEDTLTITVPPFPREGGAVHDRLVAAIRENLGPELLPYYERISDPNFADSSAFGKFGLRELTITLTDAPDPEEREKWWSRYNSDQETGVVELDVAGPMDGLQKNYPRFYQKAVASGLMPASPPRE